MLACAPRQGWQRTDRRACAPDAAPIVCIDGTDDRGHELALGGRRIVPGECARGPKGSHGGQLPVVVVDRTGATKRRSIRAPKGRITIIAIDTANRIDVLERPVCDQSLVR
jgi:hypothetical protein